MKRVPARGLVGIVVAPLLILALHGALSAQQGPTPAAAASQPCAGGATDPSCNKIGIPRVPLPVGPMILETAEQPRIRVIALTTELMHPWGLAFLPDGSMLVPERPGRLRILR